MNGPDDFTAVVFKIADVIVLLCQYDLHKCKVKGLKASYKAQGTGSKISSDPLCLLPEPCILCLTSCALLLSHEKMVFCYSSYDFHSSL
jgi:hypothetical protein